MNQAETNVENKAAETQTDETKGPGPGGTATDDAAAQNAEAAKSGEVEGNGEAGLTEGASASTVADGETAAA